MSGFIKSHPAGLPVLFFTEMWERFSYYGMRAMLVLYLVNSLQFSREQALAVYATYTGLVYLTPILGGYIADRWLGQRRAVLVGCMVMALGHFAMAFPPYLYIALGLLVAGNGFFKPNISTMVGRLYEEGDPRLDGGFTIFYMGVNLGAFFSPLVCGTLGEKLGWHYGFAAAGVGMLAGLLIFVRGQQVQYGITRRDLGVAALIALFLSLLVILLVLLYPQMLRRWNEMDGTMQLLLVMASLILLWMLPVWWRRIGRLGWPCFKSMTISRTERPRLTRIELERILAIFIIALFVIFFWMGFEQAGGTMNLFADKQTDRMLLGWEMPASYFQSINPLLILLLAPLFSALWLRLDRSRYALSVVAKQAIGMLILGLGFIVLAIAQGHADSVGLVSPLWLVMVYVLLTTGELCLSPIGLSMVSKLAPSRLAALMMGCWFTAIALANYLAGMLEHLIRDTGMPLYWFLVASSLGAGMLLLIISPLLKRLMHGVH